MGEAFRRGASEVALGTTPTCSPTTSVPLCPAVNHGPTGPGGTYECGRYRTACRPIVSDGRAGNPRVLRAGIASDALVELFAVPVVERLDATDHADAAPEDLARARIPADVVRIACAPRDQLQPAVARAERVRDACSRRTGDDGAAANRMLFRLATAERRRQLERAR